MNRINNQSIVIKKVIHLTIMKTIDIKEDFLVEK